MLWPSNCHLPASMFTQTQINIVTDITILASRRSQAEKPKMYIQNPLWGTTRVSHLSNYSLYSSGWASWPRPLSSLFSNICTFLSYCGEVRERSSHSLVTAVLSFLLQSTGTPRKNSQLWSKDDWKHSELQIKSKKIAPNLREIFFFYASHSGSPPSLTPWLNC